MMEKIDTSYHKFQKKIIPYLDGSLSADEVAEFEAFVATHPEFQSQIKVKQDEIELIKSMIPSVDMSSEFRESLEHEMKASIFNLLKEEPKTAWEGIAIKFEEWFSR